MNAIRCTACGQILTKPLRFVSADFVPEYEDGQDVVEPGQIWIADDSYATRLTDCYVTNISDVTATKYHPDHRRLNGCCGYNDSEGPNLVCQCGVEVGSEMSDCWVPRMSCFSPLVTNLTGGEEEEAGKTSTNNA